MNSLDVSDELGGKVSGLVSVLSGVNIKHTSSHKSAKSDMFKHMCIYIQRRKTQQKLRHATTAVATKIPSQLVTSRRLVYI